MKKSTDIILTIVLAIACAAMLWIVPGDATAANPSPSKREDAAAEREKILRTADQIEVVQTNLELTRTELAEVKAEMEKMKTEMAATKADNAALKAALEKSEQTRVKEREVLLEEVAKMIAATGKKSARTTTPAKPATTTTKSSQGDGDSREPAPPSRPRTTDTGFNHVVQKGDTLTLIAQAFREQGVNVTVDDIVKANDLPSREIKPGQKLFIPKK